MIIKDFKLEIQVAKDSLNSLEQFIVNEAKDYEIDEVSLAINHMEALETQVKRLEWALDFINYNIKAGIYEVEQFETMNNYQLIEFAEKEEARSQTKFG